MKHKNPIHVQWDDNLKKLFGMTDIFFLPKLKMNMHNALGT